MHRFFIVIAAASLVAALTGCGEKASSMDDITSTDITLPNGNKIVCETMRQDIDLTRGLMFRDPLPANRGMLFVYPKEETHSHFMYQVKFPIDTIWMDRDHVIVEIAANMPPCGPKAAHECPTYGGSRISRYALEVPQGFAEKNGLRVGEKLDF
jgi:uncharacterized membrane protein (UPF0127 family)